jgi:hypothetical protein
MIAIRLSVSSCCCVSPKCRWAYAGAAGWYTGPGPVVRFSVYALVQDDFPVRIVALHYGYYSVGFSLTNASDKSVDDVSIAGVAIAPPGCGVEPRKSRFVIGNAFGRVRIGPHGNADAFESDSGLHTGFLVVQAKSLEAAYLQVQAMISEVDFADGTKWKRQIDPQASPFDPSLVAVDAWKCPDAASVIEALKEMHVVSGDRN